MIVQDEPVNKQKQKGQLLIKQKFINLKKMEKTILYSKKSSLAQSINQYETCNHQHCKQLLQHIKFLSNTLTQKLLKEQFSSNDKSHINVLKSKQNISNKVELNNMSKTLEEEIQAIKKNYTKLRKQLNQVQTQNDELFQENITLQKKVDKLQETISNYNLNKSTFELSLTNCPQQSPNDTKNSFYSQTNQNSQQIENQKQSHITNRRNNQLYPHMIDLTLNNILKSCQKQQDPLSHTTDRSQVYNKYEKLMRDYKNVQEELVSNQEKIKDFEKMNKRLAYQNQQLKKIIKLRNQIQSSRHQAITGLKSVIDQIMA